MSYFNRLLQQVAHACSAKERRAGANKGALLNE